MSLLDFTLNFDSYQLCLCVMCRLLPVAPTSTLSLPIFMATVLCVPTNVACSRCVCVLVTWTVVSYVFALCGGLTWRQPVASTLYPQPDYTISHFYATRISHFYATRISSIKAPWERYLLLLSSIAIYTEIVVFDKHQCNVGIPCGDVALFVLHILCDCVTIRVAYLLLIDKINGLSNGVWKTASCGEYLSPLSLAHTHTHTHTHTYTPLNLFTYTHAFRNYENIAVFKKKVFKKRLHEFGLLECTPLLVSAVVLAKGEEGRKEREREKGEEGRRGRERVGERNNRMP